MKKSVIVRYLAYITFILIILCILPGGSLAAKGSSEHGNGAQYAGESFTGSETGSENKGKESVKASSGTDNSGPENVNEQGRAQKHDQGNYSAFMLERKQIREDLQLQKSEYRVAKEDFLKVRKKIQAGKLSPNSGEVVDATKLYLNSTISYMIVHLKNVNANMQYSSGNGTEEKIVAIKEDIKLLEAEQAEVLDASSQKELIDSVRSLREIWANAQKTSLIGAGEIVSKRIGEFLDKSENLSEELDIEIRSLNEKGVDTAALQTRLASYILYIKAAREKKVAADSIYEDENATLENLKVANNYLRESLNNVNKANQILKVIFSELKKEHDFKEI
ncbi:MAG: chromosome segregation ATPase [Euryarchaeota archaeon]|nr:chromosome segregation ATPase [Euryarchaeota archaeon]